LIRGGPCEECRQRKESEKTNRDQERGGERGLFDAGSKNRIKTIFFCKKTGDSLGRDHVVLTCGRGKRGPEKKGGEEIQFFGGLVEEKGGRRDGKAVPKDMGRRKFLALAKEKLKRRQNPAKRKLTEGGKMKKHEENLLRTGKTRKEVFGP